jgi:diguanylate cyclase (GGDEF)-like protein
MWKKAFSGFRRSAIPGVGAFLRPSNIPAAIAILVVCVAGIFADQQSAALFQQRLHEEVLDKLSLIRADLEGNINSNIQLVRGLVIVLSTEPQMTQTRFAQLARDLFDEHTQLRDIVGAPDLVASLVYPVDGNEKVLGLDLRQNAAQRDAALLARDSGKLVLAGPVDLVQGGQGFVARYPVFVPSASGGRKFWGIVSAVIDVQRLYWDSGLLNEDLGLDLAISGKDASGPNGDVFFGVQTVLDQYPITADIDLPYGSWRVSAVPKGGWDVASPSIWWLRLAILVGAALVILPIVFAGRLVEERLGHLREIRSHKGEVTQLSHRLELALGVSQIGVFEGNLESGELYWDDRLRDIYGISHERKSLHVSDWERAIHPEDAPETLEAMAQAIRKKGTFDARFRILRPDGQIRSVAARGTYFQDGATPKFIGVNWDVTADVALADGIRVAKELAEIRNLELESAKARIERQALHDALTGLPNRRYLDEILNRHAIRVHEPGDGLALLHIDLDRFKQINDTLGHVAGDAMLVHVASLLTACAGVGNFIARVGGDEFVIVCFGATDTTHLAGLAQRVIAEIQQPVPYEGHFCRFGASIGIAVETDEHDGQRILINADIALYRAKGRGRNRYEFFSKALQDEIESTKRIADDILRGIEHNEFIPYYQPLVDSKTFDVVGVEALARWHHPTQGVLTPDRFIAIAEDLNVLGSIDRAILEQAINHLDQWIVTGFGIQSVSVNVSFRRLTDDQLVPSLRQMNIEPGTISFEFVESIFLDEFDESLAWTIDAIREMGIGIDVDDFGTGHASIVSLLTLNPRRLKIDRQLITPLAQSPEQRRLVASIIDIGKTLGIKVVAEGVETMEQAQILQALGCDFLQGYAFARPMPADELRSWMDAKGWRHAL